MFIDLNKNNGKDYQRLVNAVRVANKDGYKVSGKQVVLNIGPLSRFDDGCSDFIERLRKSFKAGSPLILDAFGLRLPAKLYRRAELKSLKHDLEIFM